jgi:hypothetical protein
MKQIIGSAFSDAPGLLRSRMPVYLVLTMLSVLVGLGVAFAPFPKDESTPQMGIFVTAYATIYVSLILGTIAAYFAVPAAARTVRPGFGMTIGRFFGLLGLGYAFALAFEFGLILLVVPGFRFGVKWSQYVWTYLLNDGDDPLDESWRITTGRYWETFGFSLLLALVLGIPLVVVWGIVGVLVAFFPITAIALIAVAFGVMLYLVNVGVLAQMRWMLHLRAGVRAPAAPVATA